MVSYEFSLPKDDPIYHMWRVALFDAAKTEGANLIREWHSEATATVYFTFDKPVSQSKVAENLSTLITPEQATELYRPVLETADERMQRENEYCPTCDVYVPVPEWNTHLRSYPHNHEDRTPQYGQFRDQEKTGSNSRKGWFGDSPGHSIAAKGFHVPWRRRRRK